MFSGLVQAFTDAQFAKTLVARMKDASGAVPKYYQVILKVRSMDDMPIEISYVLHRAISADTPKSAAK